MNLSNHSRGSSTLILPVSRQLPGSPVIPSQTMNTTLNQNQSKLGILILPIPLQMLPDQDSLLNQHIQILWDIRCQTIGFQNTNNFLSSNGFDLSDTIGITKDDTNLGRCETFLGKFANVFFDIRSGDFEPGRRSAFVGEGGLGDTLAGGVHATHD